MTPAISRDEASGLVPCRRLTVAERETVGLGVAEACRPASVKPRFKRPNMHVDAVAEPPRDGGSIPPASTLFRAANTLFYRVCGLLRSVTVCHMEPH